MDNVGPQTARLVVGGCSSAVTYKFTLQIVSMYSEGQELYDSTYQTAKRKWPTEFTACLELFPEVEAAHCEKKQKKDNSSRYGWDIVPQVVAGMRFQRRHLERVSCGILPRLE